ncbi:MAG TPA: MBL fold metallo-hydrolase [bacterium]|nr:MBL fold metallo-hydrolase [bacterium]
MERALALKLSDGLFLFDTFMGGRAGYTSVFAVIADRAAILDSGVSVTAGNVLAGLTEAGAEPADVAWIALTHAHYDHAGGAHELLRLLEERGNRSVKVACAEKPAVYIGRADICEKLMRSGRATDGSLAGDMLPIGRDRILVMKDGDALDLGGLTVRALDAPGHANGHLIFHVPEISFLFVGDACGLLARDPAGRPVIAPTAFAPEYRHDDYINTMRRIAAMGIARIGCGHFGTLQIEEIVPALEQAVAAAEKLRAMAVEIKAGRRGRDSVLSALESELGPALISLYPSRERMLLSLKTMIAGSLHDLERDAAP